MKIIEAMKKIKDLNRKCLDLQEKLHAYSATMSVETPYYGTADEQTKKVSEFLDSHRDSVKEIGRLRFLISKTNISTPVTIQDLGVTKTIAEWIQRRKDLSNLEATAWTKLSDRGMKDQLIKASTPGAPDTAVKVVRHYDVLRKDKELETLKKEPSLIDAALEVVNAITDLVE